MSSPALTEPSGQSRASFTGYVLASFPCSPGNCEISNSPRNFITRQNLASAPSSPSRLSHSEIGQAFATCPASQETQRPQRRHHPMELQTDLLTQTAPLPALGYSKSNGNFNSTLEIFKIKNYGNENHSTDSPPLLLRLSRDRADHGELKEKYKSLIRQLPSKPYLETLSRTYFREVNYEYYPLDEDIFRDHLKDWNNLSFSTLSKGPPGADWRPPFLPGASIPDVGSRTPISTPRRRFHV